MRSMGRMLSCRSFDLPCNDNGGLRKRTAMAISLDGEISPL